MAKKISCRAIRPIDIEPGMTVIVSEWYKLPDAKDEDTGWPFFRRPSKPDNECLGDPILVLAVALPFITIRILANNGRGVMDTRKCAFMVVDKKYVRSLIPTWGIKTPPKPLALESDAVRKRDIFLAKEGVWKTITEKKP
jgi:hypothetical protein